MKKTQKTKRRKAKMPQYQIEGIKIMEMLKKLQRPSGIKDAVEWLHQNR